MLAPLQARLCTCFLCSATAFWVRGWLKYCHYFVNILSLDLFWRVCSNGFLSLCFWYLVLLRCFALVTSQTSSLHHLEPAHSSAALPQLPCIPSRTLLLRSLKILPVSWHFPTHKIIVGVLWNSYSSSFHIFHIRTATSVLLIWYCPSAHWMLKSTQKSLRAQGKSYNCGINAFYCSDLALSKKRGMGQTLPFPNFLVSLGDPIYSDHFKFPVPKLT